MNATLLGLALIAGAPGTKEKPEPSIVGSWILESRTNGRPIKETTIYEFTAEGKWLIPDKGLGARTLSREFKTDRGAKPYTIDVVSQDEFVAEGVPLRLRGIYKIEGDTFTLCLGRPRTPEDDPKLPTEFKAPEGSQFQLLILKRAKKKD
jgi:uncharacterized protein (TIGR03067 family)